MSEGGERRPALEPGFLSGDDDADALLDEDVPTFLQSRPAPEPRAEQPPAVGPPAEEPIVEDDVEEEAWAAFAGDDTDVVPAVDEEATPAEEGRRRRFRRKGREDEPDATAVVPAAVPTPPTPGQAPDDPPLPIDAPPVGTVTASGLPPALQHTPDPQVLPIPPPAPPPPPPSAREAPAPQAPPPPEPVSPVAPRPTPALEIDPAPATLPAAALGPPTATPPASTPPASTPPASPGPVAGRPPATAVPGAPGLTPESDVLPSAGTPSQEARWRSDVADYEDQGWEEITAEFRALRRQERAPESDPLAVDAPALLDDDDDDDEMDLVAPGAPLVATATGTARGSDPLTGVGEALLSGGRNLAVAVATGLAFGLLALLVIRAGRRWFLGLAVVVVMLALVEFYTGLRQARFKPAAAPGLLGALMMLLGTYTQGTEALGFGLAMVLVFTLLWFQLGVIRTDPVANLGVTLLGVLYVAFLASFAIQILAFPDWAGITIGYLAITVASDVGGYLVGSRLGRTYVLPEVSPHKSLEGLLGGGVLGLIVALVVIRPLHPFDLGTAVALGVVVTVAAPMGDLLESAMKRAIGVKDLGSLLPGHGGVIDRIDSILVVAPAVYVFARLAIY